MAAGLPTVRRNASGGRAIDAADTNPRTCPSEQPLAVLAEVRPQTSVIVVNEYGIVLGRIDTVPAIFEPTDVAEDIGTSGPAIERAHESLDDLLRRMGSRGVEQMIVTTPEGRLLGGVHSSPKT